MKNFTNNTTIIQTIKKDFLIYAEVPLEYDTRGKREITIYRITNKVNGKVYIGKTINLEHRAGEYISRYVKQVPKTYIENILFEYGIENFIMEPIAYTSDDARGMELEKYFISYHNALNPSYGYNKSNISASCLRKRELGDTQSIETKESRCKYIVAIDVFKKDIVISTGGMLYGKTIGKGKDIIKNGLVRASHVNSYFVYYLEPEDREPRMKLFSDRYNNRKTDRGMIVNNYIEYCEGYKLVEIIYSLDSTKIHELESVYSISFVQYAQNDNGYEIVSVDEFLNKFSNISI